LELLTRNEIVAVRSRSSDHPGAVGTRSVATTYRHAAADVEMIRGLDEAGVPGKQRVRFQPKDAVPQLLERITLTCGGKSPYHR
jgi:hypothetical protein